MPYLDEQDSAHFISMIAQAIQSVTADATFLEGQLEDEEIFRFYNFPVIGAMPTEKEFNERFEEVLLDWVDTLRAAETMAVMLRDDLNR